MANEKTAKCAYCGDLVGEEEAVPGPAGWAAHAGCELKGGNDGE